MTSANKALFMTVKARFSFELVANSFVFFWKIISFGFIHKNGFVRLWLNEDLFLNESEIIKNSAKRQLTCNEI